MMRAGQLAASLIACVRDAPDADDASLDAGRHLCCSLQASSGSYDSLVVFCDRGEYEAVAYELLPGSPARQFWVSEHSCIIAEVWLQGRVIAAGVWQVDRIESLERYTLRCLCSTGLEIRAPEEGLRRPDRDELEETR